MKAKCTAAKSSYQQAPQVKKQTTKLAPAKAQDSKARAGKRITRVGK